jgi:hypothetical protein
MSSTTLNGGGDTVFTGSGVNDSVVGSADGDSISGLGGNDTLLGNGGADTLLGGADNDLLNSGVGSSGDSIYGDAGDDQIIATGDAMTIAGGGNSDLISVTGANNFISAAEGDQNNQAGDDKIYISGDGNTVNGAAGGDTVYFDGANSGGNFLEGGSPNGGTADFLVVTSGAWSVSGDTLYTEGGISTLSGFEVVICFAEGSDILTAHGEVRVEKLQAGDLVATVSGQGAPMKPVLWVGRRKLRLAGNPAASLLAPVRIAAGALGECTPHRDLLVSPDHCLYVDGALVPARLLVNGTTITVERDLAEVTYYHVELEGHDVLLANGAAAESWLDAGNRAWFENAGVAMMQVADAPDAYATATGAKLCAPVLQGGEKLAAIRDAIALRGETVPATPAAEPRRAAG